MLTPREIRPLGFGKKVRGWHDRTLLLEAMQQWAKIANRHMELAGLKDRIDHRSLEARGIERQPAAHLGPRRTRLIRQIELHLKTIEDTIEAERRKEDPFLPDLDTMLTELEAQIDQL